MFRIAFLVCFLLGGSQLHADPILHPSVYLEVFTGERSRLDYENRLKVWTPTLRLQTVDGQVGHNHSVPDMVEDCLLSNPTLLGFQTPLAGRNFIMTCTKLDADIVKVELSHRPGRYTPIENFDYSDRIQMDPRFSSRLQDDAKTRVLFVDWKSGNVNRVQMENGDLIRRDNCAAASELIPDKASTQVELDQIFSSDKLKTRFPQNSGELPSTYRTRLANLKWACLNVVPTEKVKGIQARIAEATATAAKSAE